MATKKRKTIPKQYVKLDYEFLHSPQRMGLSLAAREVYLQLKAARNVKKRGKTINTTDDYIRFGFKDSNGMSKPTFQRAVRELVDRGFVRVMTQGEIPNRKSAYALVEDWKVLDFVCEQMGRMREHFSGG